MCTRLHAIGFPCAIDRRTAEFIADIARTTTRRIVGRDGEYRIWRSQGGAEIWLHYPGGHDVGRGPNKDRRRSQEPAADRGLDALAGISIGHTGTSDVRLRLVRKLSTSQSNPLEGVGVTNLPSTRGNERPLTFTFELLGFAAEAVPGPMPLRMQLIALAQRIWSYPTERAYLAGTPSHRLMGKGAVADVRPSDVPEAELIYRTTPGALWLISGDVVKSMRLINPVTSAPYIWLSLSTDRGLFDVLANPDSIEGDISVGHVAQALVAVTGRILQRL